MKKIFILFFIVSACSCYKGYYAESAGLSIVENDYFTYYHKSFSKDNPFVEKDNVKVYAEEIYGARFYMLFWSNNQCYFSRSQRLDASPNNLCFNRSGYKGYYYQSNDTIYTEIITADSEHLYRNYLVDGDTLRYVEFSKLVKCRKRAIKRRLSEGDKNQGTMTLVKEKINCEELKTSFWH